jgi:hypothetical protein
MADQRQSDVLGALPRTRPHRRSAKRPQRTGETAAKPRKPARTAGPATRPSRNPATAQPGRAKAKPRAVTSSRSGPRPVAGARSAPTSKSKADRLRQPPQPRGIPRQPRSPVPPTPERPEILGTVVQAAAELTEIGLSLGAHLLRRAVARLPRP